MKSFIITFFPNQKEGKNPGSNSGKYPGKIRKKTRKKYFFEKNVGGGV